MKALYTSVTLCSLLIASTLNLKAQPPVLVTDITVQYTEQNGPLDLYGYNGRLYFSTYQTATDGYEPWISDGTAQGTHRILNIMPDTGTATSSSPIGYVGCNGIVYFTADDGIHGRELWRTDGTAQGTYLVKDINSGSGSAFGYFVNIVYNNKLFFAADNGGSGPELWVSDGTTAGTHLVKNINTLPGQGSQPSRFTICNNELYFVPEWPDPAFQGQVWKTDGTNGGTIMLCSFPDEIGEMVAKDGALFFCTGMLNTYKYTPTTDDLLTLAPGLSSGRFLVAGNNIFFLGQASGNSELYVTDGTVAGTHMVKDITMPGSSDVLPALALGNSAVFYATDDAHGRELWITDGTEPGTHIIKDIRPGADGQDYFRQPIVYNSKLYFPANTGTGYDLYVSDGTDTGSVPIDYIYGLDTPRIWNTPYFTLMDSSMYMLANYEFTGTELYRFNAPCASPVAAFTYTVSPPGTVSLHYTGSAVYDSLSWDFGDGTISSLTHPDHYYSTGGSTTVCLTLHHSCGDTVVCQTIQVSTSVSNIAGTRGFTAYPNPAGDVLFIDGADGALLGLYDVLGRKVRTMGMIFSTTTLDISALSPGIYLLRDERGVFAPVSISVIH